MENIEYSGYWWLPFKEDEKIAGTLTFTNDEGIKLRVIGSFYNFSSSENPTNIPIILGLVHENIITLHNCTNSFARSSTLGPAKQEYFSELALIGRHFTKLDELCFNKARVQYSYLSDWVKLPEIKREPEFDFIDRNKVKELRFTYTAPENIEGTTKYGKFSVIYKFFEAKKPESIDFKQYALLMIQPNEKLSFNDFNSKFISPLNNFMTFANDRTNSITKLELFSPYGDVGNSEYSRFLNSDFHTLPQQPLEKHPIEAIYQTIYPERKKTDRLLAESQMLFSLSEY